MACTYRLDRALLDVAEAARALYDFTDHWDPRWVRVAEDEGFALLRALGAALEALEAAREGGP